MNLTYTLTENGYVILNDGVKWIEQSGFIPYQGDTMEESAKKHMAQVMEDTLHVQVMEDVEKKDA